MILRSKNKATSVDPIEEYRKKIIFPKHLRKKNLGPKVSFKIGYHRKGSVFNDANNNPQNFKCYL